MEINKELTDVHVSKFPNIFLDSPFTLKVLNYIDRLEFREEYNVDLCCMHIEKTVATDGCVHVI